MKAISEAIEGASEFADFLRKATDDDLAKRKAAVTTERRPGENRKAHRARLKRERRERAKA